jgi:thermitase
MRVSAVPNDPRFAELYGLNNTGQTGGTADADIDAPEGWDAAGLGAFPASGGVKVGIVDTGIRATHEDLSGKVVNCAQSQGLIIIGGSIQEGSCADDNGHGTHVGGIIAARNNTLDVVGVASEATLYAVKVLDNAGNGADSTVMLGLEWVAKKGATQVPPIRVVNMSLGRAGQLNDNAALRVIVQTLYNQGITVVVSAGNEPDLDVSQQVPATYPEVLAIASSTALDGSNGCRFFNGIITADTASSFTTDGRFDPATGIGVTVSAPGEDRENVTRSCFSQSVGILSTKLGGGTTRMSGTSMAAPHAAGVVALMWEKALLLNSAGLLHPEDARATLRAKAALVSEAPLDSPTTGYRFDGEREGILSAPSALQ